MTVTHSFTTIWYRKTHDVKFGIMRYYNNSLERYVDKETGSKNVNERTLVKY